MVQFELKRSHRRTNAGGFRVFSHGRVNVWKSSLAGAGPHCRFGVSD